MATSGTWPSQLLDTVPQEGVGSHVIFSYFPEGPTEHMLVGFQLSNPEGSAA